MRCSTLMRWTVLCAALILIAAPAALAQDPGHEHGHGHDHAAAEGQAAPSAEEQAAMAAWQESMTPGPQHAHLAKGAGKYNMTIKSWMAPGAEPMTSEGTAVRSMTLGGRVMVEEVEAMTMGQPFHGVGRTGYDNITEKYWSTWNDDMSTGLTVLYGTMNEDGTGTFEGQTADPMTGGTSTMRIKMRTEGGKEINDFFMVGPDGSEMKMMEITYTPAS